MLRSLIGKVIDLPWYCILRRGNISICSKSLLCRRDLELIVRFSLILPGLVTASALLLIIGCFSPFYVYLLSPALIHNTGKNARIKGLVSVCNLCVEVVHRPLSENPLHFEPHGRCSSIDQMRQFFTILTTNTGMFVRLLY